MRVRKGLCLLVGPLPPPATGQSVSFEMLYREAQSRGIDVRVVDISRRQGPAGARHGLYRAYEILRAIARYLIALTTGARRVYITIAQSRAGFLRDFVLIWLARGAGAAVVVHLKGGNYDGFYEEQPDWLRWLIRASLRQTERILVLGEGLRDMYSFDAVLENRVEVVPNGLPVAFDGLVKKYPDPGEPIRILFLSNMIVSKGYWDLLDAIGYLQKKEGLIFDVVFAGAFMSSADDPDGFDASVEQERFVRCIEERKLSDRVCYVGPVRGSEKWKLLESSHVFVLPTAYVNEGQPVSIIEAMAYGCVVISTRFRAIPDLVEDGVTGVLVNYKAPEEIASAIWAVGSQPARFVAMSEASTERYQKRFSMSAHLDKILPYITGEQKVGHEY